MCGESVCCFTSGPGLLCSTICCICCVCICCICSTLVLPLLSTTTCCNKYYIKELCFVPPHRTWNTFRCSTFYIEKVLYLVGCKTFDEFCLCILQSEALIIVTYSELLNNQSEAEHQWLWPVWSQLEVFKSPTEHFLVPVSRCKNQRHSWRHKIFNGYNFKN